MESTRQRTTPGVRETSSTPALRICIQPNILAAGHAQPNENQTRKLAGPPAAHYTPSMPISWGPQASSRAYLSTNSSSCKLLAPAGYVPLETASPPLVSWTELKSEGST
mmetsp:Transcript_34481/g.53837  ORF Transcript_34481/g.53837 Transcript_34481/m.53837 type:complete len:109 (-) Transcript_34481:438-764(-)